MYDKTAAVAGEQETECVVRFFSSDFVKDGGRAAPLILAGRGVSETLQADAKELIGRGDEEKMKDRLREKFPIFRVTNFVIPTQEGESHARDITEVTAYVFEHPEKGPRSTQVMTRVLEGQVLPWDRPEELTLALKDIAFLRKTTADQERS